MAPSWSDFLFGAVPRGHGVQVYRETEELADTAAEFFAVGFEQDEPGVLVARREHATLVRDRLRALGWITDGADANARLIVADAAATLAALLEDGRPGAERFNRVIGDLLASAGERADGPPVRVFGEMVDLLVERGDAQAAVELEQLWNDGLRRRNFSLLCAYRLDIFDPAAQATTIPDVCRAHSHVLPAQDPQRLARAVDRALDEVLGSAQAGKVYLLLADEVRAARLPTPQLLLMWVSANMPTLAKRVLAAARRNYAAEVAASGAV
jgi:hypothetical protein